MRSVRSAFSQRVHEACCAEGIALSDTNRHTLSGDIGVHGAVEVPDDPQD